jgi:hypothetical protein
MRYDEGGYADPRTEDAFRIAACVLLHKINVSTTVNPAAIGRDNIVTS